MQVLAGILLVVSVLAFVVATVFLALGSQYFSTWYYCWAWWSVIVFLQSLIKLKGKYAELFDDLKNFLFISFFSVPFWLFFELVNIRLGNWYYVNLPSNLLSRWVGYFIAYATVLPAIFTVKRFLEVSNVSVTFPYFLGRLFYSVSECPRPFIVFTGIVCFVSSLVFPAYCFPLVWVFLILLLDPINGFLGVKSFIHQWKHRQFEDTEGFLLSGFICGILWESLNFWAGSKWRYSLPFFNSPRIFEMPVLGYLGFLPFALECAVFTWAILHFRSYLLKKRAFFIVFLYMIIAFACIDIFTVHSFK